MSEPAWVRAHLGPGERARWWARPASAGVAAVLLSGSVAVGATIVSFALGYSRGGLLLTGAPALVVALGGVVLEVARRVLRLLRTSYVVTDERLYVLTSRFTTDLQVVPLAAIARVELRQGPLGRLFGYWSARVGTHGEAARPRVLVRAIEDGPGLLEQLSRGAAENAQPEWILGGSASAAPAGSPARV